MSRRLYFRKTQYPYPKVVELAGAAALIFLAFSYSLRSAENKKVLGVTLLGLQHPFLVAVDNAMKAEAAKQGDDLVSLDPRQRVATELQQVEKLIAEKVDLIVMIPVDQKASQTAGKLINAANIPLVLLNERFSDDYTVQGGRFATYIGSEDTDAGKIEGQYLPANYPKAGTSPTSWANMGQPRPNDGKMVLNR